ncbi:MAG TPA: hypothetical protein VK464_08070, partial [Symbiobacteriaceae bacterium]|nr:hypothetical protein [Symbiobacteriaceae bacterium]
AGKRPADLVTEDWGAAVGCLHLARVGPDDAALTITGPADRSFARPAVFAWQPPGGTAWRVVPIVGGRPFVYLGGGHVAWPDVYLVSESGGSGGYAALLHGRLDQQGRLAVRPVIKEQGHDRYDFPAHGLVLHTYRGPEPGPMAWTCNACLPTNHQELLRWTGHRFAVLGQRVFSTPDLTANLFVGALAAGQPEVAAQYFTSPELVAQVGKVLGPTPAAWRPADYLSPGSPYWRIREAELRNWTLLPAAYRRTLPADLQSYRFPLERGRERITLKMVRLPRGWLVNGLELSI